MVVVVEEEEEEEEEEGGGKVSGGGTGIVERRRIYAGRLMMRAITIDNKQQLTQITNHIPS